jgi:hypothetical protein
MFRVEIETQDLGFFPPETTGLPHAEQVFLVTVHGEDRGSRHAIVSPGQPTASLATRLGRIAALFPTRQISVCLPLPHTDGQAQLISQPADRPLLLAAAAAAATLQRSGSWDESEEIVVTITTPEEFRFVLDPVYEKGAWVVRAI